MPSRADIEQLATWLAATDLAALELTGPDGSVRLERRGPRVEVRHGPHDQGEASCPVAAPSPGIFLHAHPLRRAALVQVGDDVRRGQVIGLLRIGALLLPVCATHAGRITGYWAEDGATVGYGAPLIALQRSETSS